MLNDLQKLVDIIENGNAQLLDLQKEKEQREEQMREMSRDLKFYQEVSEWSGLPKDNWV